MIMQVQVNLIDCVQLMHCSYEEEEKYHYENSVVVSRTMNPQTMVVVVAAAAAAAAAVGVGVGVGDVVSNYYE